MSFHRRLCHAAITFTSACMLQGCFTPSSTPPAPDAAHVEDSSTTVDARVDAAPDDVVIVDAATPPDVTRVEDASVDVSVDAATADASVDVAIVDASTDAAIVDGSDVALVDASADAPAADVATDVAPPTLPPGRALFPLAWMTVTTRRPTFRWAPFASGSTRLEVCADVHCTRIELSVISLSSNASISSDLSPGAHFWRITPLVSGGAPSEAREFFVPTTSRSFATGSVSSFDLDRDGYADVVIPGTQIYPGSRDGTVSTGFAGPSCEHVAPGDFDGDGLGDLYCLTASGSSVIYAGLASGSLAATAYSAPRATIAGDVDGDGQTDLARCNGGGVEVFSLTAGAWPTTPTYSVVGSSAATPWRCDDLFAPGDIDGDGRSDLVVRSGDALLRVVLSSAEPHAIALFEGLSGSVTPAGDLDGDGRADLATTSSQLIALRSTGDRLIASMPMNIRSDALGSRVTFPGELDASGHDFVQLFLRTRHGSGPYTEGETAYDIRLDVSSNSLMTVGGAVLEDRCVPLFIASPPMQTYSCSSHTSARVGDTDGDGLSDTIIHDVAAMSLQVFSVIPDTTVASIRLWHGGPVVRGLSLVPGPLDPIWRSRGLSW